MNLPDYLVKACLRFPEHEALVYGNVRYTMKALIERIFRVSNALLNLGLKKGDRVGVLLHNCHQSVECFFGIQCAGCVLVPLNARNSVQEHLYILENSEAKALMIAQDFLAGIRAVLPSVNTLTSLICVTGRANGQMLDYEELLCRAGEIIAFCKQHLASYKKPQSVDFVDEIPKTAVGKISRRMLREPYWSGKARNVN